MIAQGASPGFGSVSIRLVPDVSLHRLDAGLADRKRIIPRLPGEVPHDLVLDPPGSSTLALLDHDGDARGSPQRKANVDVIRHPANDQRGAVDVPENPAHLAVQPWLESAGDEGLSVFRAEEQLDEDRRQGLGQGMTSLRSARHGFAPPLGTLMK
jgi:hypothetical protein